jgi:hypothetical protein
MIAGTKLGTSGARAVMSVKFPDLTILDKKIGDGYVHGVVTDPMAGFSAVSTTRSDQLTLPWQVGAAAAPPSVTGQ